MSESNPPLRDPSDSMVRLEEHMAHTERTVEELSGEIAELNRRMKSVADRIAAIESRLFKLMEGTAEDSPAES